MHRHWNRALLCALAVVATGCPKPSQGRLDALADRDEPALFEIVAEGAALPPPDHHLQLAREGLAEVERLDHRGRKEKAYSRLLRAQADAELAMILAVSMSQSLAAEMERLSEPAPVQ